MDVNWTLMWGIAATYLALAAVQLVPRGIRSVYTWTATALFGSLSGRRRTVATIFAGLCFLWVIIIAGAIYTPLTLYAPRVLPFPGGLVRMIILVELWLLVIAIPVLMGAAEIYFTSGTFWSRLTLIPRAFVHVVGIALALFLLIPWILWRFILRLLKRKRDEQYRLNIDLEKYDSVAQALVLALRNAGLAASVQPLPPPVRASRWCLRYLGPPMLRPKRDYEARRIVGDGFGLIVFDGLVDATTDRNLTSRVRLAIIGRMPPDGLWLTQSEEARSLEEVIRSGTAPLAEIPRRIAEVDASLEEWRVLSWEYTQILASANAETARVDGGHLVDTNPPPLAGGG